jgi:hypothetical protein
MAMDDIMTTLDDFIAACEARLFETALLSPRARVLTCLIGVDAPSACAARRLTAGRTIMPTGKEEGVYR